MSCPASHQRPEAFLRLKSLLTSTRTVLWRYRLPTRERESSMVFVVILYSIIIHSGKSESITITNEKGRLLKDDIDRMIREAEDFAAEDEVARKRIEALDALSSFVYGLKR